jgi:hypothetical protein
MARRDTVTAVVMILAGAAAAWEAGRLPFGTVRNPGQGFFPWWLGVTLAGLSVVLLVNTLARRERVEAAERGRIGKVLGVLGVLALYALALEPAGYPACTFVVVLFMLRVTEPHRWPVAIGVALGAALGSYLLFGIWLKVPLPAGPFAR